MLKQYQGRGAILILVAAGLAISGQARAYSSTAALRVLQGPRIKALQLQKKDIPVRVRYFGDRERTYVLVRGEFPRKDWSLTISGRKIQLGSNRQFAVRVPLMQDKRRFKFVAIGPRGKVENQNVEVYFGDFKRFQSARKKRFYLIPSIGGTMNDFEDSRIGTFQQTAITGKIQAYYLLIPPSWDVAASLFYTLTTLSAKPNVSVTFMGINFRFGYNFQFSDNWSFSLLGGFYYITMFVDPATFGFKNLSGPQLYPVLKYQLGDGSMLYAYGKFSPVADQFSLLNLKNREIAAGGGYTFIAGNGHPITITVDYANLKLNIQGVDLGLNSLTLGISYGF